MVVTVERAQGVFAGLGGLLVVAKTGRTAYQSQNLNTPEPQRLHHTMEAGTALVGLGLDPTVAVEVYLLLRPVFAEARDHRSLLMAAGLTQPLLGSHTQRPEPIKLRQVGGVAPAVVADLRDFLLLLAATYSMSHRVGDPSGDVQRLQQLHETMAGRKVAAVRPGTRQVRGCSASIQRHSSHHHQQRVPAVQSRGIVTGHQAASRRGTLELQPLELQLSDYLSELQLSDTLAPAEEELTNAQYYISSALCHERL